MMINWKRNTVCYSRGTAVPQSNCSTGSALVANYTMQSFQQYRSVDKKYNHDVMNKSK